MRKTKIICTIGPASEDEDTLRKLALAGMNVARLNFSHGSHEEHGRKIALIKKVREELNLPLSIMLDTKGPEYRIGTFENGSVEVKEGQTFIFTTEDVQGDSERVSVSYKNLHNELKSGDSLSVCNGIVTFKVSEVRGKDLVCICQNGGVMSNRKSMSFPNKVMSGPYLSEQDKADILFGIQNDVDFIAASFVSRKSDLEELDAFLEANGGSDIDVIAKIENQPGCDNIDEICELCEGVMVARGDLGVEVPFVKLPALQKDLITKCRLLGKRVITATEMLESMISNPRPTRAEISDVANAVYDGSSAIMLSGETASGKYPVQALTIMSEIASETENDISYAKRFAGETIEFNSTQDAISHAACSMAIDTKAKVIVACTRSGRTARMISRFRCPVTIVGMTTDKKVWRKLSLNWGVCPVLVQKFPSQEVMFFFAFRKAVEVMKLNVNDKVILVGGPAGDSVNTKSGNLDTIKIATVDEETWAENTKNSGFAYPSAF